MPMKLEARPEGLEDLLSRPLLETIWRRRTHRVRRGRFDELPVPAPVDACAYGRMLGFDFVTPRFRLADILRWHVPLPKYAALRSHPVGLRAAGEHLIKAADPPCRVGVLRAVLRARNDRHARAAYRAVAHLAEPDLALTHARKIRPIMTRHEQAASFMACGYAMYTNRLGFCFATAGPGAFNLFSGLAVAMSDSYPVLAVSGYSSRKWQGWGSLNETSGLNRTPDSQAMFAATTKKSYLLTDVADTYDVLEEAVNITFEGRPGPVHIHVPED